jgi:hypothetical protein
VERGDWVREYDVQVLRRERSTRLRKRVDPHTLVQRSGSEVGSLRVESEALNASSDIRPPARGEEGQVWEKGRTQLRKKAYRAWRSSPETAS